MHLRLCVCVALASLAFSCDQKQISSLTPQLDAPDDLLVTSDSIYFSESVTTTSLKTMPINGGTATQLASGLEVFARGSLVKDDSSFYWFATTVDAGVPGGTLFTASLDGGNVRVLAEVGDTYTEPTGTITGGQLFLEAGHLYWSGRQHLWTMDVTGTTPTSLYEYQSEDGGTATRLGLVTVDARGVYFLDDSALKLMPLVGGAAAVAVPSVPISGLGGITVTPTHAYWSANALSGSIVRAPLDGADSNDVVFKQDGIAIHAITSVASEGENVCFLSTDIQLNTNTVQCLHGEKVVGLAQGSGRRFYGLQVHQDFAWFFDTTTGSTKAALFKVDINGSASK